MANAKKKAAPKKCAENYEPKLKVQGSFDDVIKLSVGKKQQEKKV